MKESNENTRAVILRILDANANRCAEGLRVVEEIARFSIEDEGLTGRLKGIRHDIRSSVRAIASNAIEERDSAGDVGRASATRGELSRDSLGSVARANFARVEEGLRVLEEFGKLLDENASLAFKSYRFDLYTLEKAFFGRSAGSAQMPRSPFLYAILDRGIVAHRDVPAAARDLVAGLVDMIQYRAKGVGESEMRRDLVSLLAAARERKVPVIVNDEPALARETGADGVHVGKTDASAVSARVAVGPGGIVGASVEAIGDLERLPLGAIDYFGVGALFPTTTKEGSKPLGLEFLRLVRGRTTKTLVAIGGIRPAHVADLIEAGADGIASASALLEGDVRKNCFTFREIIDTRLQR